MQLQCKSHIANLLHCITTASSYIIVLIASYSNTNCQHQLLLPPGHVEWLFLIDGEVIPSANGNVATVGSSTHSFADVARGVFIQEVINVHCSELPVTHSAEYTINGNSSLALSFGIYLILDIVTSLPPEQQDLAKILALMFKRMDERMTRIEERMTRIEERMARIEGKVDHSIELAVYTWIASRPVTKQFGIVNWTRSTKMASVRDYLKGLGKNVHYRTLYHRVYKEHFNRACLEVYAVFCATLIYFIIGM